MRDAKGLWSFIIYIEKTELYNCIHFKEFIFKKINRVCHGRACPPFLFDCHGPWQTLNLSLARVLAALAAQELSACQKFKLWGVLCLCPLTLGRPARCVSASRVWIGKVLPAAAGAERCQCLQGCGHCGMVDKAVAHVLGFEGPWQTGHQPRDVVSCHLPRVPPSWFGRYCYTGAHWGPQPTGCSCGLYLAPFPHVSQQCWLAQPSPNALSPFDPTSYGL